MIGIVLNIENDTKKRPGQRVHPFIPSFPSSIRFFLFIEDSSVLGIIWINTDNGG